MFADVYLSSGTRAMSVRESNLVWPRPIALMLAIALTGCSYGVDAYFRILIPPTASPLELVRTLDDEIRTWPEFDVASRCDDAGHIQYTYNARLDSSITLSVVLNASNATLAYVFTELGKREFSQEAERLLTAVTERLRVRVGAANVQLVSSNRER